MTETEALAILNLKEANENEIIDAFELICFQEKQSLYKDPILPAIIDSRIKKIERLGTAYNLLMKEDVKSDAVPVLLHDLNTPLWKDFFQYYELNKAILRKELSNANNIISIINILKEMKKNEISYGELLLENLKPTVQTEVRLSVQVPIIEIVAELNPYLEQGAIDNSFSSLKKLNEIKDNFKLYSEVNRVKKLLHGA